MHSETVFVLLAGPVIQASLLLVSFSFNFCCPLLINSPSFDLNFSHSISFFSCSSFHFSISCFHFFNSSISCFILLSTSSLSLFSSSLSLFSSSLSFFVCSMACFHLSRSCFNFPILAHVFLYPLALLEGCPDPIVKGLEGVLGLISLLVKYFLLADLQGKQLVRILR